MASNAQAPNSNQLERQQAVDMILETKPTDHDCIYTPEACLETITYLTSIWKLLVKRHPEAHDRNEPYLRYTEEHIISNAPDDIVDWYEDEANRSDDAAAYKPPDQLPEWRKAMQEIRILINLTWEMLRQTRNTSEEAVEAYLKAKPFLIDADELMDHQELWEVYQFN